MLSILKERKEKQLREEEDFNEQRKVSEENELKEALARKCADLGGEEYVQHEEDETEYTILTLNGNTIRVRKEEITIESHGLPDPI